jgi:hypothetical protein
MPTPRITDIKVQKARGAAKFYFGEVAFADGKTFRFSHDAGGVHLECGDYRSYSHTRRIRSPRREAAVLAHLCGQGIAQCPHPAHEERRT